MLISRSVALWYCPTAPGKTRKVLVFAKDAKADAALAAGADYVGWNVMVEKIQKEKLF